MPNPSQATETETSSERKSRLPLWVKWLLWTTVIVVVLGWLLNGFIARKVITYQLNRFTTKQEMQGSARIEGTILSGFSIKNADYSGTAGIKQLQFTEATVNYTLQGLLNKDIGLIQLLDAQVTLDTAKFPPGKKTDEDKETKTKRALATLRPWITNPEIDINNLDLTILKNEKLLIAIQLEQLTHAKNSGDFQLKKFTAQDSKKRSTPSQDIQLTWLTSSASISRWELLPQIIIESAAIDWKERFQADVNLQLYESHLDLTAAEKLTLHLNEGELHSSQLQESLRLNLPAEFSINKLECVISNWQQPKPLWNLDADIGIDQASYQDYQLNDFQLTATQAEGHYQLKLDTIINQSPVFVEIDGKWQENETSPWWANTELRYKVKSEALADLPNLWIADTKGIDLTKTQISIHGDATLSQRSLTAAQLNGNISGIKAQSQEIPALQINSRLSNHQANLKASTTDIENTDLNLQASYNLTDKSYTTDFTLTASAPQWINALCKTFNTNINLDNAVKATWNSQGNITQKNIKQQTHTGSFSVSQLHLNTPNTPVTHIDTSGRYNWPQSLNIDALHIQQEEWKASSSLSWDGQKVIIPAIILHNREEAVLGGSASIPLTKDTIQKETFFAQSETWNIALKTQPLTLKTLSNWFKFNIPNGIQGSSDIYLELGGSPKHPQAEGFLNLNKLTGLTSAFDKPVTTRFDFQSLKEKLKVTTTLHEGETQRLSIDGLFPFSPNQWINKPNLFIESVKNAPIKSDININSFPLAELSKFVPQLEKIQGSVSGQGSFQGSINQPIYTLNIQAKAPILELSEKSLGSIQDIQLDIKTTEKLILNNKLSAQVNGGKFEIQGDIDINDIKNPTFNINLDTQYAMVYRDDLVSTRANGDLNLKGSIQNATISGNIGIVESLVYKDIELIPIGVPSSEVAQVKLPALTPKSSNNSLPIPTPFNDWKLNITLQTEDPILLRGNVAKGYVQGSLNVTGTLAKPEPNGTLYINNMRARLPFSLLAIDKGEINFSPQNGLTPTLKILGTSSIGSYDVNLLIHGSTSEPKTSFTSSPPLPESEIMSLLATGATTGGLANADVAAFKAFQILLMKMEKKQNIPGGNQLSKALLSSMKNLNLNVGEVDQFTGRKYSSAKVEFNKNWYFTAQVDNEQNTRGLVVYVIRFR